MIDSESVLTPIRMYNKTNMRNVTRNVILPLIVMIAILFCLYIAFKNKRDRENFEKTLNNYANLIMEQRDLINELYKNERKLTNNDIINNNGPTIFAITPTFSRPVQKAELTRLSQTFMHIKNFHWIVIEDSQLPTKLVTNFLSDSGLSYKHLNVITPIDYKLNNNDPHWKKPRGIAQRNAALMWLRNNFNSTTNGIVYFADDDNTYSIKLFKEMMKIKVIGVWPVGLVGGLMVEKPICDNVTNKVIGFNAAWKPERIFPIDMAGFAINLKVIIDKKNAWFSYKALSGYHETALLEQMVNRDDLEPLADHCTKVYVWHTRTESPILRDEQKLNKKGLRSDDNIEV